MEAQLQRATGAGGVVSLLMLALLALLAAAQVAQWRSVAQSFEFLVDRSRSHEHSLQINVDLTVAMDCAYLRADVLDVARSSLAVKDALHATPVVFHSDGAYNLNTNLNSHNKDIDVAQIFWQRLKSRSDTSPRSGTPNACRFAGTFQTNKVEGMLHFTAMGHGYYGSHTPHNVINFTHRIDELSFGPRYPGLWNPLDHTLEIGTSHFDNFMYFVGVVPTIYVNKARSFFTGTLLTNQYAVTEFSHAVDESKPDAIPGIFIKYNIEPISVRVTESRMGFIQFITRMNGIIGGAFVTIGATLTAFQAMSEYFKKPSVRI
eukprot:jgi/Hompol1/4114/HPOL_003486-RA